MQIAEVLLYLIAYNLLIVTEAVSHRFRDIVYISRSRKPPHPNLSPRIKETPFEFIRQTYVPCYKSGLYSTVT